MQRENDKMKANAKIILLSVYLLIAFSSTVFAALTPNPWAMDAALTGGARYAAASVSVNHLYQGTYTNYLYVMTGFNGANSRTNTIQKGTFNPSIETISWVSGSSTLPLLAWAAAATSNVNGNDYLYVIGGSTSTSTAIAVRYAQLNPTATDGAVGSWGTSTTTGLPSALEKHAAVTVKSGTTQYVYVLGGTSGSGKENRIFRSTVSTTNGALGSWTAQTIIPVSVSDHAAAVFKNSIGENYIYVIGGTVPVSLQNPSGFSKKIYRFKVGSGGALTSLGAESLELPIYGAGMGSLVLNNKGTSYLYVVGGYDNSQAYANVMKVKINDDGSLNSEWDPTETSLLPAARKRHATLVATAYLTPNYGKHYVYAIGGLTSGDVPQSTAYKASEIALDLPNSCALSSSKSTLFRGTPAVLTASCKNFLLQTIDCPQLDWTQTSNLGTLSATTAPAANPQNTFTATTTGITTITATSTSPSFNCQTPELTINDCATALDCNDNLFCKDDSCTSGSCMYADKTCDDSNPCTTDSCNELTDSCKNTKPDTTECAYDSNCDNPKPWCDLTTCECVACPTGTCSSSNQCASQTCGSSTYYCTLQGTWAWRTCPPISCPSDGCNGINWVTYSPCTPSPVCQTNNCNTCTCSSTQTQDCAACGACTADGCCKITGCTSEDPDCASPPEVQDVDCQLNIVVSEPKAWTSYKAGESIDVNYKVYFANGGNAGENAGGSIGTEVIRNGENQPDPALQADNSYLLELDPLTNTAEAWTETIEITAQSSQADCADEKYLYSKKISYSVMGSVKTREAPDFNLYLLAPLALAALLLARKHGKKLR